MRKSLLAAVSAASIVLAFGAANAQVSIGGNAAAGAAGAANATLGNNAAMMNAAADANAAASLNINANDVTAEQPFGDIDIAAAIGANADIGTWINGLSAQQRVEFLARCNVIGSVENRSRFNAETTALCDAFMSLRGGQAANVNGGVGVGAGVGVVTAAVGDNAAVLNAAADAAAAAALNITAKDTPFAKPFGNLDVAAATGANADVQGWINSLSTEQRVELLARCNIVGSAANRSGFSADATALCDGYTSLRSGQAANVNGVLGIGAGVGAGGVVGAAGAAGAAGAGGAVGGALGAGAGVGGAAAGAGAAGAGAAGGVGGVNVNAGANVGAGGAVTIP